ncbi:MAG: endonuclease III [Candidatus Eisenbacteria bacterium]|nr:endonuclease III [Candidatus Eisenbacteria bacterium]
MSADAKRSGRGRRVAAETRRLARIAELLEDEYGAPKRRASRDLIGSLVSTVLSQNTRDANSGRAYSQLRVRFPTWGDVADARPRSIESAIRSGGLARTKAGRIRTILRSIEREEGSLDLSFLRELPTEEVLDYLRGFEGVGAKTAACVALFGLGRDVMPVDTHVHRVVGRLGVIGPGRGPEATFAALRDVVPRGKSLSLHVNLIRLGRTVCRPRRPGCGECPLRRLCAHARGIQKMA